MVKKIIKKTKKNINLYQIIIIILFLLSIIYFVFSLTKTNISLSDDDASLLIDLENIIKNKKIDLITEDSIIPKINIFSQFLNILFLPTFANTLLLKIYSLCLIALILFFMLDVKKKSINEKLISISIIIFSGILFYFTYSFFYDLGYLFLICTFFFIYIKYNKEFKKNDMLFFLFILSGIFIIIANQLSILIILVLFIDFFIFGKKGQEENLEFFLFFLLFYFWFYLLILRIPMLVFKQIPFFTGFYFLDFNFILNILMNPGFLVILFFSIIYIVKTFKKKSKNRIYFLNIYLIILAIFIVIFKKINLANFSFMLIALIINFSKEIKELKKYLKKTKLDKYQNLIVSIIIIFVCVNLFYSNLFNSNEELFNLKKEKKEIIILSKYLDELHQKNESNHIVLTPVEYSNIIKYYSNLNIVLSKNELLNSKKQKYITDYDEMLQYDSNYKLKIFKEYNAKYAIVKKEISKGFNSRCFLPISETENFRLIENVC